MKIHEFTITVPNATPKKEVNRQAREGMRLWFLTLPLPPPERARTQLVVDAVSLITSSNEVGFVYRCRVYMNIPKKKDSPIEGEPNV